MNGALGGVPFSWGKSDRKETLAGVCYVQLRKLILCCFLVKQAGFVNKTYTKLKSQLFLKRLQYIVQNF